VQALPFRLAPVSVVGLLVEGLESLFEELSADRYTTLLNQLAEQIEDVHGPSAPLFSYAGDGVFLTIKPRPGNPGTHLDEEFTLATRSFFRNAEAAAVISGTDRLNFVSGHPVSLPMLRRSERESALKKAKLNALQGARRDGAAATDNDRFQDRDSYRAILQSFSPDKDEFWEKRQERYSRK
jgi:hypothetical protein